MDTTHMSYTAEDLIAHKLQRAGLLIAKPKFDREGADLLAFMKVKDGARFCRIQCKGRSLIKSKSSNVKVPKNYVEGTFILFLFIEDGEDEKTSLFCFLSEDIKKEWKLRTLKKPDNDYYSLSLSKATFNNPKKKGNLIKYTFNNDKIASIKQVIKKSNTQKELRLIDLLKQQSEIVKLQKRKYELEALMKELDHTEKMKKVLDDKINILEDNYKYLASQAKQ